MTTPPPLNTRKPVDRKVARTVMLVNQFATPGLGSLLARRWAAGIGQLLLAGAGFLMIMGWFIQVLIRYYSLIDGATPASQSHRLGGAGAVIFFIAWLWSLVTSISVLREASRPPPLH